jgi:hypothetical protein
VSFLRGWIYSERRSEQINGAHLSNLKVSRPGLSAIGAFHAGPIPRDPSTKCYAHGEKPGCALPGGLQTNAGHGSVSACSSTLRIRLKASRSSL